MFPVLRPQSLIVSSRFLSSNRCAVTRVKRETFTRTYDTLMVLPDGATITVRYPQPREIVRVSRNHRDLERGR